MCLPPRRLHEGLGLCGHPHPTSSSPYFILALLHPHPASPSGSHLPRSKPCVLKDMGIKSIFFAPRATLSASPCSLSQAVTLAVEKNHIKLPVLITCLSTTSLPAWPWPCAVAIPPLLSAKQGWTLREAALGVHLSCSVLLLVLKELDGYLTSFINLQGKVYSINYLLEN